MLLCLDVIWKCPQRNILTIWSSVCQYQNLYWWALEGGHYSPILDSTAFWITMLTSSLDSDTTYREALFRVEIILVSHPGSSRTATSMQLTLEVVLWVGEVTWQIRTLPALPEELNSIFTTHTVEYNNLQLQFQVIWHHFLGFEDTT